MEVECLRPHCRCMQLNPCAKHHYSDCQPNWGKKADSPSMNGLVNDPDVKGCGICGGLMVFVRGRHPGHGNRLICPTCLAEKMDNIREIADKDYGRAFKTNP